MLFKISCIVITFLFYFRYCIILFGLIFLNRSFKLFVRCLFDQIQLKSSHLSNIYFIV